MSSRGLRVLITNNTLAERAGSELYVRDVAIGLLRRGHKPVAYSTKLGRVAEELRAATVPVTSDLNSLGVPPDVIHGHHHLETMTALLHFPGVPAISFCHGWIPWEETVPRFPRILRYVAVDDTCHDRLLMESGIPAARTRVLLNFVDMDRFQPRAPLPEVPRRALVFSNGMSEETGLGAVRQACHQSGIELHVAGLSSDSASQSPENLLPRYDIVFAKARCALEAMAVGTAVILCDVRGSGSLVTTANLSELRRYNFGIRTLTQAVDANVLTQQIARYQRGDAALVSGIIRNSARLEATCDELLALYREVIAEYAQSCQPGCQTCDLEAEEKAAAAYLQQLGSLVKGWAQQPDMTPEVQRLQAELRRKNDQAAEAQRLKAELAKVYSSPRWRFVERLKRMPLMPVVLRYLGRVFTE